MKREIKEDRENKFKAWYSEAQIWVYLDISKGFATEEQYNIYQEILLSGNKWYQFTGRKDIAGKEAYEGDVLQFDCQFSCKDKDRITCHIIWDDGISGFNLEVLKSKYMKPGKKMGIHYVSQSIIIGNRFENPELLTTK